MDKALITLALLIGSLHAQILSPILQALPAAAGGPSTPTFVQSRRTSTTNASTVTSAGTFNYKLPGPTLAGNAVVCALTSASSVTWTLTTDQSQTMTALTQSAASNTKIIQFFYLPNATTGTRAVSASPGATKATVGMSCFEVAGIATTSPLDAQATSVGAAAATTVTGGALTGSVSGDLALFCAARTQTPIGASATAGSGFALVSVDRYLGAPICEFQVLAGSSVTPTMTWTASNYASAGALFKAAVAGTAGSGLYIAQQDTTDILSANIATGSVSITFNQPTVTTNQVIEFSSGEQTVLTDVTDSGSCNWYRGTGLVANNSVVQHFYTYGCTASAANTITLHLSTGTGGSSDATVEFTQLSGLASGDPLDMSSDAYATDASSTALATVTLTPTNSNGIILSNYGQATETATDCTGTGFVFMATTYTGQSVSGPSTPSQNNGWCYFLNSNTTSRTFTYSKVTAAQSGAWAGVASSWLGNGAARTGTWQEPRHASWQSSVSLTSSKLTVKSGDLVVIAGHSSSGSSCTVTDSQSNTINAVANFPANNGAVQTALFWTKATANTATYTVIGGANCQTGEVTVITDSIGTPTIHTASAGNHGTASATTTLNHASQSATSGDFCFAAVAEDAVSWNAVNANSPWHTGDQRPDSSATLGSVAEWTVATSTATISDNFTSIDLSISGVEGIACFAP